MEKNESLIRGFFCKSEKTVVQEYPLRHTQCCTEICMDHSLHEAELASHKYLKLRVCNGQSSVALGIIANSTRATEIGVNAPVNEMIRYYMLGIFLLMHSGISCLDVKSQKKP